MITPLHRLLTGPFHFFVPCEEDLRAVFSDAAQILPRPQRIFLDDESTTPLHGFPILLTPESRRLEKTLESFVEAEERLQLAVGRGQAADARAHGAAWDDYASLLLRALENVLSSSFGRQQPGVFWLYHSLSMARIVRDAPRRLVRLDPGLGRSAIEAIRFRALERLLERQATVAFEATRRVAREQDRAEPELFAPLFNRLRDNLLVLAETHVSSGLEELSGYFSACLQMDSREFGRRLEVVMSWHETEFPRRPLLRETARWIGLADGPPRALFRRPGYLRWLVATAEPAQRQLWDGPWVETWERLLLKLKEFEVLHGLRRLVVPVERAGDGYIGLGRRHPSGTGQPLRLSPSTRPLDFLSTWVVNPEVERSGMVYDISSFSEILSRLGWSGNTEREESSRAFFRFQRRVGRVATSYGMMLEKYLGDGAFFSSRRARPALVAAVHVQRAYEEALRNGLPFDRGLRIAIGFGSYRLLPVEVDEGGTERYEFYGQGLVELTRLTSGKSSREIDEIKHLLLTLGYPENAVNRFFAPLVTSNVELVDRSLEQRRFYAYLNRNGTVVNEGIVATGRFIERLLAEWQPSALEIWEDGDRRYAVVGITDGESETRIGLRKLGVALLKGLDRLPVFEVVDAAAAHFSTRQTPARDLLPLLQELHASEPNRRVEPVSGRESDN